MVIRLFTFLIMLFLTGLGFSQPLVKRVDWKFKQVNWTFAEDPNIQIDWIKPRQDIFTTENNAIDIELRIISERELKKGNFQVEINWKKGFKADEAELFTGENTFTYEGKVNLPFDVNELVFRVIDDNDIVLRSSSPKMIHVGSKIRTEDVFAYWVKPNPNRLGGESYKSKEKYLYVEFNISSKVDIGLKNLRLQVNKNEIAPSQRAEFKNPAPTKYFFSDYVKLDEAISKNMVHLNVQLAEGKAKTETLRVVYSPLRPNLHIISIGPKLNLNYTENDAKDFADLFKNQGGSKGNYLFSSVEVNNLLIGKDAKATAIANAIRSLELNINHGNIAKDDAIILFISSHGSINETGELIIQGQDFNPNNPEFTSIKYKQIIEWLNKIPCKKIVFLDACHSGQGGKTDINAINTQIHKWNKASGVSVLSSSKGSQISYEDPAWQNGAFTEAIVQGLKYGKADGHQRKLAKRKDKYILKDGIITLNELYNWIADYVPEIVADRKNGAKQNPMFVSNQLGDLAIFILE